MDRRQGIEQQTRDVSELRTLLDGRNWIDAIPLLRPPRFPLEIGYRCSSYLGLFAVSEGWDDPSEPMRPSSNRLVRLAELVRRIDRTEFEVFVMGDGDDPDARSLQRSAQFARVAWPRSLSQQRAGLSVRAGLDRLVTVDDEARDHLRSPADGRISAFFESSADVAGVSGADLVHGLVALSAAFATCHYQVEQQEIIDLVARQGVRSDLAHGVTAALTCGKEDVDMVWRRHWRHQQMGGVVVPHGPSAADLRPLIAFGSSFLLTNPRAVAMACERFVDELVLGTSEIWPAMNTADTNHEEIVRARGQALERATATALGSALTGHTVNPTRLYAGINFSTDAPGVGRWRSDGELDVLVGCGRFQVTVECKASSYNGTDIAPAELIGRPLKQLRTWRASRGQAGIRFAADNKGTNLDNQTHQDLVEIAAAPVAVDIIVSLDDFGLLPTAVPLALQHGPNPVEPSEAPTLVAFPDLWEVCQVLTGPDLLSYLAQRLQLTRSGIPHMAAEDGCLYSFLRTGHLLNNQTADLLRRADTDYEGLFAWKGETQGTDTPTVATPRPQRVPELHAVLNSLSGPDAEVAHALFTFLQHGDARAQRDLGAGLNGLGGLRVAVNHTVSAVVIYGTGGEHYDEWPQSETYLDALHDTFKTGAKPRLIAAARTSRLPVTVVTRGDPGVLVEPFDSDNLDLDSMLYDRERFNDLLEFKMPPYSACPCGSGQKYKWCPSNHPPVPSARSTRPAARSRLRRPR